MGGVILEAGLILEGLLALLARPQVVLRVGQLVAVHGGQLEEGLVASPAEVDPLLDVYLTDVTVQPGIRHDRKNPLKITSTVR